MGQLIPGTPQKRDTSAGQVPPVSRSRRWLEGPWKPPHLEGGARGIRGHILRAPEHGVAGWSLGLPHRVPRAQRGLWLRGPLYCHPGPALLIAQPEPLLVPDPSWSSVGYPVTPGPTAPTALETFNLPLSPLPKAGSLCGFWTSTPASLLATWLCCLNLPSSQPHSCTSSPRPLGEVVT